MIKITADSICDLSPEILIDMEISLIPLNVIVGDESYQDGVDISPAELFELVEKENKICKTAAANIYDYECFFEKYSDEYEGIIHICLSSAFSSSYQNAKLASESFENVYVIDSKNLSSGSGHIVYEAALMANGGMKVEDILKHLEDIIARVDSSFVIDKLDYLHKGGRCSGVELIGSKMLQIKPSIEVINGEMSIGKKYRGSFQNALRRYVKDRLLDNDNIDYRRIFITHPMCDEETVDMVRQLVKEYGNFEEIIETKAGCTISSHCGPNTLGILYIRKS